MSRLGFFMLSLCCFAFSVPAATFTVTTTAEVGPGSLTQAILDANANLGFDRIEFAIPPFDTTVKTIVLNSTPPPITDAVLIDGYTQPNTSSNTLEVGHNAIILIRIHDPTGSIALVVAASESEIQGLIFDGVTVQVTAPSDVTLRGNFFGTDPDGLNPGVTAVRFNVQILGGENHRVGGFEPAGRNLLANATHAAIVISDAGNNQLILNNYIGTQRDGVSSIGNDGDGILIIESGSSSILDNVIAHSTNGIVISGSTNQEIIRNRIFSNGGLGIDLVGLPGPDANDGCDADVGANDLQNFPVLINATGTATSTTIFGVLESNPFSEFFVEFFANTDCDESGFGEGAVPIGSVLITTDGECVGAFSVTLPVSVTNAPIITATATDAAGNTSEFSECISVTFNLNADLGVTVTDTPDPVVALTPLTYSIVVTNFGPNPAGGVTVTNFLPTGATFNSATPSVGSCTNIGSLVQCDLATLAPNVAATITLVVTPTIAGVATNSTFVTSAAPDPFIGNNAETTLTTVLTPNRPPVITSPGNRTINEGQTLSFTLTASDPDNDPLTFSVSGLPPGASFDATAQLFTWTPSQGQTGTFNVTFAVSDGSLTDSTTVTITVNDAGCPSDVTSLCSVRVGRLLRNLRTGRCYHRVTISNNSGQNLPGPFNLVLDDLPSGVTLLNGTGTSTCPFFRGLPYRAVNATSRPLRPRRRLTVVLEYRLEPGACPTFTPLVLAGNGTP